MSRGTGRIVLVAAGLTLAIAPFALADTQLGEIDNIEYWKDSATATVPNPALAIVACPDGTSLLGGGFGSASLAGIPNDLSPVDTQDADHRPDAFELTMTFPTATQTGDAYAFCAPWDVSYPSAESKVKSLKERTVTVKCPGGKSVTGGGARLQGTSPASHVNSSYPIDGKDKDKRPDDGWRVRVWNGSGAPKAGHGTIARRGPATTMTVSAVAVCASKTFTYRKASRNIVPSTTSGLTSACHSSERVVGAGVRFGGPAAGGVLHVLDSKDLSADGDAVPDDDVLANGGNTGGSDPKKLTTFAICR